MMFFAGFCLGCFVAVLIFMVIANWRKPEYQDTQWLKDNWKYQLKLTEEKNEYLKTIAENLRG